MDDETVCKFHMVASAISFCYTRKRNTLLNDSSPNPALHVSYRYLYIYIYIYCIYFLVTYD